MRWLGCAACILALLVAAPAAPAAAQDDDPFAEEPAQRERRVLGVVSAAGAEGPGAFFTLSGLGQLSLAKRRFGGPDVCGPESPCDVRWYVHGMGGVGVTYEGRFAAQAQLGLLWKPAAAKFVSRFGPVAQYVHPGNRVGPALRVEFSNNLGLAAGALFEGSDVGYFVSLDVYHDFLSGLGIF